MLEYELLDHGMYSDQYFQGCGTAFTDFECVVTGNGDNFAEAIEDCLGQIAEQYSEKEINVEELEKEILADNDLEEFPTSPSVSTFYKEEIEDGQDIEIYYYVSIRFNLNTGEMND